MARPYALTGLLTAFLAGGCFSPGDSALEEDSEAGTDEAADADDDDDDDDDDAQSTGGDDDDDDDNGSTGGDDDDDDDADSTGGDDDDDDNGSTGDDDDDDDDDDDSSTGDAAPQVIDVQPAEASTGVLADAEIVVTFSEPMDTMSTAEAFSSPNIKGASFSWSDNDTVLTITPPGAGFVYATGTDPATVDALEYTFSIATTATDVGGVALEEQLLSNFFTARQITQTILHDPSYSGGVVSNGTEQTGAGGDPVVGDHSDNLQRKGILGFSLSGIPDGVLTVNDATISAEQYLTLNAPFAFGAVSIHHVAPEPLPGGLFDSASLASLGIFSNSASNGPRTANATDEVTADINASETHTQFRLEFPVATDNDGVTDRTRYHDEVLVLEYLVP